MRHPFELEIAELENINFELEELEEEVAEKIVGGNGVGTLSVDFAGLKITTMATGEEGGERPIKMITN